LGPDGELVVGSPAWVVKQIFTWTGDEGRTAYWVASHLNELEIHPLYRTTWAPKTVIKMVYRHCYTGKAEYNANGRVPNPERPLGDLTLGIKKTRIRPKPEQEKVAYEVPSLVSEDLWLRASNNLRERGRGRGKQGRRIEALFRTRLLCPRCGKPLSVLRKKGTNEVYYYCRAHYCPWLENPCTYNRFVPGTWDAELWEEITAMLGTDAWLEQQLGTELSQSVDLEKLVRPEQFKINQAKQGIGKVQEGWEKGFYQPEEVHHKLEDYRRVIAASEAEIRKLQGQMSSRGLSSFEVERLRQDLQELRDRNLWQATFAEKADLVARLGIKVIPSEDLKSRKILCRLNLAKVNEEGSPTSFAKVTSGGPVRTVPELFYKKKQLIPTLQQLLLSCQSPSK